MRLLRRREGTTRTRFGNLHLSRRLRQAAGFAPRELRRRAWGQA